MASTKRKPTTGAGSKATVATAADLLPKLRKVQRYLRSIHCVADLIAEQECNCCAGAIVDMANMAKALVERLIGQASGAKVGE